MRLTPVLFKYRPLFTGLVPKFPGSADKGKNRFVKPATKSGRYLQWDLWKEEERVLKYIAKPYVTKDEELIYLESIGLKHQDVDPLYTSRLVTPMRQRYSIEVLDKFERNRSFEYWQ